MSSSRAPAEGEELYDEGGCDHGNELKEFKRQARQTWYSEHAEVSLSLTLNSTKMVTLPESWCTAA